VADDDLLFFFPSAFNFNDFHTPLLLPLGKYNCHFNLPVGYEPIKKPAKKSFRVLAGIWDKPKGSLQLCLLYHYKLIYAQKQENIQRIFFIKS
jgi:hypothetical protein